MTTLIAPTEYHPRLFGLPSDTLQRLTQLQPKRSIGALLFAWIQLIGLVSVGGWVTQFPYFPILFPFLGFAIASRQGVLLQLIHEGSHGLIHPNPRWNDAISQWACSLPIGIFFSGYTSAHRTHHAHPGSDGDPKSDSEKYSVVETNALQFYFCFVRDLMGWTALKIFFRYQEGGAGTHASANSSLRTFGQLCAVQVLLLMTLFQFHLFNYFLFWLVPAMCFHMFLMRIRGIAEHGRANQKGYHNRSFQEGLFHTRTMLAPGKSYRRGLWEILEKFLIGSLNVHYHHEHHLYPRVPFYHLPELHQLLREKISAHNPGAYVKGYFAALLIVEGKAETQLTNDPSRAPQIIPAAPTTTMPLPETSH